MGLLADVGMQLFFSLGLSQEWVCWLELCSVDQAQLQACCSFRLAWRWSDPRPPMRRWGTGLAGAGTHPGSLVWLQEVSPISLEKSL